jgi:hypothetical protein
MPVTVITIACKEGTDFDAISYYKNWLARTLQSMCPAGTIIEIEIRTASENGYA